MCLIVNKPRGVDFNYNILSNAWTMNADGAGFMTVDNGRLIVEKGFFKLKKLLNRLKYYNNNHIVVHFRWATHGVNNKENCHPFRVGEDVALVHNGTFKISIKNKNNSDTWHFADKLKKCGKVDLILNPDFKKEVEEAISKRNKVVFMKSDGTVEIYNEDSGHWLDGCWYSNENFVFGSWNNIKTVNNRIKLIREHYKVQPSKKMKDGIFEGDSWFCCENCYDVLYTLKDNKRKLDKHILCESCYKDLRPFYDENENVIITSRGVVDDYETCYINSQYGVGYPILQEEFIIEDDVDYVLGILKRRERRCTVR